MDIEKIVDELSKEVQGTVGYGNIHQPFVMGLWEAEEAIKHAKECLIYLSLDSAMHAAELLTFADSYAIQEGTPEQRKFIEQKVRNVRDSIMVNELVKIMIENCNLNEKSLRTGAERIQRHKDDPKVIDMGR